MRRERKIFYRDIDRELERSKIDATMKNFSQFH